MSHKHGDSNFGAYNFILKVKGISVEGSVVKGWFTEVSGLDSEVLPVDYRNGSNGDDERKMPGLAKFQTITLKRGITNDIELWNWILNDIDGQLAPANGSIILLNENRQEVMCWNFIRGWPSKCIGPSLNEKSNVIAIETLEICCEGLNIDD
jgi:phage tail-like protein